MKSRAESTSGIDIPSSSLPSSTMARTQSLPDPSVHAIDCRDLSFAFAEGQETVLQGVDLQLEQGSRCLLVGANGGLYTRSIRLIRRTD